MNKVKLLTRLQEFFNADEKQKREKAEEIKDVIEKLKTKQLKITRMLSECQDEQMKKALQMEVDIIKAQIEKGNDVLKELYSNS
ncbi:hypothetical protein Q9L42_018120 [Methylomarinum sp. Ch1-1]|uniref:Uncharacterized protein n=1 Tax=Methylomarinum roseum TaxID=3067653 RepID=A0AAU7NTF4_9GAMM|nr:hypothetical protein [Methylomarinum sp. Ch1-1]MDP4519722.1 hypothetical protein [Methylomarinum sp. Ch1-1]